MKNFLRAFALLLAFLVSTQVILSQEAEENESSAPPTWQQQLSPEYMRIIYEASRFFTGEQYDEALKRLDDANKILVDTPISLNLRGAVYTELEDWEKAREFYNKALEIEPNYFAPKFNLGEILFLKKEYQKSLEHFLKLYSDFEDNEVLQFKICVNYLMLKDNENAIKWRDAIKFPSNTPAYYFANAAYHYDKGEKEEARQFINSSLGIFNPQANLIFIESLSDLGWLEKSDFITETQLEDMKSSVTSSKRSSQGGLSGGASAE